MTAATPDRTSSAPELELEFPPKAEFVRLARHTVAALARLHEVPDDVVDNIKLAVSEACTTSILSPRQQGDEATLLLRASVDDKRMIVDLIDPSAALLREITGPPSDLDTEDLPFEQALSLPVIRGLVDELGVTTHEGKGRALRMVMSTEAPSG